MPANVVQTIEPEEFIDTSEYQFTGNNATVERKWCFITWLRRKATVYHAAQAARVNRVTVYRWHESDPQFAEAWEAALQDAREIMETSIYEDALGRDGKRGDPILKMFWTKAHDPRYRDKVTVDVSEVQHQIEQMFSRFNINPRELPQAVTRFIDTEYSQVPDEYLPVATSRDTHFPDSLAQEQKDNVSRETSD